MSGDLRSIHLVEYRATVGMIWHLIVILLFLLLKFAKALAILCEFTLKDLYLP